MKKKNILMILADQLSWKALPIYGDKYVKTPNIDRIANTGVAVDGCYTACPLCQPARAAIWSSTFPSDTNIRDNLSKFELINKFGDKYLGEVFQNAGYETVHFGKKHDAGTLKGFNSTPMEACFIEDELYEVPYFKNTYNDKDTTNKVVSYIDNRTSTQPLFLVADLENPHDICSWIGERANMNFDNSDTSNLPEVLGNYEFDDIANRPRAIQYICCSHRRQAQAANWTEMDFRWYLKAYYHYIEVLDKEIGLILDSLEKNDTLKDTLIVFTADHGDAMGARGRVTKQVAFYEEETRVPFILSGFGVTSKPQVVKGLMSSLDIYPTLCSMCGIEYSDNLRGKDISLVATDAKLPERDYVVSQWHAEWDFTVSPGRMICTGDYKYTKYIELNEEELFDLKNDPLEKINLAKHDEYKEILVHMRGLYKDYIEKSKDDFETLNWYADDKWRSHEIGYSNHKGLSAPGIGAQVFKRSLDKPYL